MGKFNFEYKDSIKKIRCIYTFNNKIGEDTSWEGYILVQNIDGILSIEGYENDSMDSLERNGNLHLRYILGNRAISYADESLVFEIYPDNIAPIHYDMHYNKEDGCFYGKWLFMPTSNHLYSSNNKDGDAIIRIEDVMVDEKEVRDIIKRISTKYKSEYSNEIEAFRLMFEFMPKRQISLFDKDNYSIAVKKLSRFSNIIK